MRNEPKNLQICDLQNLNADRPPFLILPMTEIWKAQSRGSNLGFFLTSFGGFTPIIYHLLVHHWK